MTLTCLGRTQDRGYYYDGIEAFFADDDTTRVWSISAIFDAMVARTNDLLPEGLFWLPNASEIHGPASWEGDDASALHAEAWAEASAEILADTDETPDDWSSPAPDED